MSIVHKAAAVLAACGLTLSGLAAASPAVAAEPAPTYYVSLGDSLATGWQPDSRVNEPETAYTNRLYEKLKQSDPNLRHEAFGCAGATARSVLTGSHANGNPGACSYDEGTQLAAAVKFLEDYPGQVKYVSVGIGANDVHPCVPAGADGDDMLTCLTKRIGSVGADLSAIDAALLEAGGAKPRYVGMTYYNPFLAGHVSGNEALASLSIGVAKTLNDTITAANTANGFLTADVAGAFSSNDTTTMVDLPGYPTKVPLNVARICTWTWMCSMGDIHANDAGHQKIADAFAAALAPKPQPPKPNPPKPAPAPVVKVTTSTTAKLVGKHRITTTKRAYVRVRVRAARGVKPGGVLVVRDGKRILKKVRVGATGKRLVHLPRLKRGKHRITVTYRGSATTRWSRSNPIRLKVVVPR
ncbi:SGNH/GDSL hydrolase family protein [Mumia sp. DW29H23]|uniref:SGNH/GDSL hydrolase family protein n=1 Tax=Mumia sp. DW29H23 TaxID=3421241 RepID=UPI003D697AF9